MSWRLVLVARPSSVSFCEGMCSVGLDGPCTLTESPDLLSLRPRPCHRRESSLAHRAVSSACRSPVIMDSAITEIPQFVQVIDHSQFRAKARVWGSSVGTGSVVTDPVPTELLRTVFLAPRAASRQNTGLGSWVGTGSVTADPVPTQLLRTCLSGATRRIAQRHGSGEVGWVRGPLQRTPYPPNFSGLSFWRGVRELAVGVAS